MTCTPGGNGRVGRVYVWFGGPADAGNPSGFGPEGAPANADVVLAPANNNALCVTFPPDGFGAELAIADRTGDGILDLVVSDPGRFHDECEPNTIPGRGRVSVYRGGTATLALAESIDGPSCSTGCSPGGTCGENSLGEAIAAGEVDGDARADLVMSLTSSTSPDVVRVLYGDGSSENVTFAVSGNIALADVNADGRSDVAATGSTAAALWLGGTDTLTPTAWSASYPAAGSPAVRLSRAGQQNADCYEDLALAAPNTSSVRIFRGQAGSAGPLTTPAETISKAWTAISPAGDPRRDGIDDLLTGRAAESRYEVDTGTDAAGAAALYQGDVPTTPIPDCDGDGDGTLRNLDCDDRNPAIEPGAVEVCNLRDDDCDNLVDEGLVCNFADADADGIFDDGNHSGVVGDARCTGGATQNCDDNCQLSSNASQADGDADSRGDSCDNCAAIANADQADGDSDAVGSVCDSCTTFSNPRESASFLSSNPWATLTGGQRDDDHDGFGTKCDAKFPGVTGTFVGTNDLTQFRASNTKDRAGDTCGTTGTRPCAIFDLDQTGTFIGSGDLTQFRVLNTKAPGPRCAACTGAGSIPLPCTAGTAGTCGPIPRSGRRRASARARAARDPAALLERAE